MSICAYPQVRIYEDFDKMSAKEVYYNEAGNKITVKLLHFPDVPPEDINKMRFDDDDDNDNDVVSFANGQMADGEEEDDEREGGEVTPVPTEDDDGDGEQEVVADRDTSATATAASRTQPKKALRKKTSTPQLHSRKCSIAFAQAHGIKITPPPTPPLPLPQSQSQPSKGVPSWSASSMPTILYPSNSASAASSAAMGVAEAMGSSRGGGGGGGLKRSLLSRRSPSPSTSAAASNSLCPGYAQYSKSLLEVPMPRDYGYASSDDLSSEWDSDVSSTSATRGRTQEKKPSGWRKIRNIVQWTPFFQTYKKQRYPWVQLAGHQGNFKAGPEQGTVLKKLCPKEEDCFQVLMKDVLRPYVPEYKGQVTSEDGESVYLQLQDLLSDFHQPCVMDCKIGVRTYLEEELSKAKEKPKLRKDMYEKMIQIDPDAPSEEEHKAKGVTKPRYMVWRETISSTATLGFRIEGIKKSDGTSSKDFKTTKSREQIMQAFREFINGSQHALPRYIQRLRAIRATLECSDFFRTHEVIGSSLLFVHDRTHASVWLIDFAKTVSLPANHQIDHNTTWKVGNHEDGYLIGINNLIELFGELKAEQAAGGGGGSGSNELSVSTASSSTSSSASMSPMRSVSESNNDDAQARTETASASASAEAKKTAGESKEAAVAGPGQETALDSPSASESVPETRPKEEVELMEKTQSQRREELPRDDGAEVEKF